MTWTDPLLGRVLNDRYEVEARIGRGGFGVVYRVRHTSLGKALALKALFKGSQLDPDLVARFEREAQATSRIGHPNIVDVVDYGRDDVAGYYFIMEFLDGRTVAAELKEHKVLKPVRAIRIARQIASALLATHENGIVHRDLKPENVMLLSNVAGGQDFVKVLDFGVAGLSAKGDRTDDDRSPRLTTDDVVFGTPQYMAPEQAVSADVTPAADIYSFGIILYEMITGKVPFDAPSTLEILEQHRTRAPEQPSRVRKDLLIPGVLDELVMKCLAKDPSRRWESAAALVEHLDAVEDAILRGVPAVWNEDRYQDSSLFRLPQATGGPPLWLMGMAAALVGVVTVAVVMYPTWSAERPPETSAATASTDAGMTPSLSDTAPAATARPTASAAQPPAPTTAGATERPGTPTPIARPAPAVAARVVLVAAARPPEAWSVAHHRRGPERLREWTVEITSVPAGAKVRDVETNEVVGKTPFDLRMRLDVGARTFQLTRSGYSASTLSVDPAPMAAASQWQASATLKKKTRRPKTGPRDPFADF